MGNLDRGGTALLAIDFYSLTVERRGVEASAWVQLSQLPGIVLTQARSIVDQPLVWPFR